MNCNILVFTFLFSSLVGFSQDLIEEAVYFDNQDNPYKIERKYLDSNDHSVLYVRHNNDNSVCVKRQEFKSKDTTIIQESYFSIFSVKTKIEKFKACNKWVVLSNNDGDTVKMTGYNQEELVGDTILIGVAAKNNSKFTERINNVRIPMILKNEITINLDSLILIETLKAYYVNNIPLKVESFDSKHIKESTTVCEQATNSNMICRCYFVKDTLQLYAVDTITWNKDTTKMRWSYTRFEWHETSISQYLLAEKTLYTSFNDSTQKEIEFLTSDGIFQNIFIGKLVYDDVLYFMELRYFDREKIVKVVSKNCQTINNLYTFDNQNRIIEQREYKGQDLQKRIIYNYKK